MEPIDQGNQSKNNTLLTLHLTLDLALDLARGAAVVGHHRLGHCRNLRALGIDS